MEDRPLSVVRGPEPDDEKKASENEGMKRVPGFPLPITIRIRKSLHVYEGALNRLDIGRQRLGEERVGSREERVRQSRRRISEEMPIPT